MRTLVFFLSLALAVPVFAQEKKTEKKAAAKKKPAKDQEWGRFNSGGNKALEEKTKKEAKK